MRMGCSISICGSCDSRDIFSVGRRPGEDLSMDKGHPGVLRIDRHANSIDPLAAMTDPVAEWEVRQDDPALAEAFEGQSNFGARMRVLQVNKGWYEYFSYKRSDWLILDAGPLRYDLLTFDVEQEDGRRGTAYLEETVENKRSLGKLVEMGALPEPAGRLMPEDMPDEEFDRLMGAFCDRILELYDEDRIILHEFYPAEWYVNGNRVNAFSAYSGDTPLKFSRRMARGFAYYRQRFPRAHVIEFPHGVPGDAKHPLGKACLHYVQEYYDYALAAVEIIVGGGSRRKRSGGGSTSSSWRASGRSVRRTSRCSGRACSGSGRTPMRSAMPRRSSRRSGRRMRGSRRSSRRNGRRMRGSKPRSRRSGKRIHGSRPRSTSFGVPPHGRWDVPSPGSRASSRTR